MRVENPCDWVIERLRQGRPFFTVRINDGEMTQMYRTKPEGALLGTSENPAYCHWACGDEYLAMLKEMAPIHPSPDNILIGCSTWTPRADALAEQFGETLNYLAMADFNLCNEHWPLDGVVDGSTVRMLEAVRESDAVLVTCEKLMQACEVLLSRLVLVPTVDSWSNWHRVYEICKVLIISHPRLLFVWAGGGGLKPMAWNLWRKYPGTSHIDVGHLFNGALGLRDYGWLQRGDGPWHEAYFRDFVPWFKEATG